MPNVGPRSADPTSTSPLITQVSPPASRASKHLGRAIRLTARPVLTGVGAVVEATTRFGPDGVEMWSIWPRIIKLSDYVGLVLPPLRGSTRRALQLEHCAAECMTAAGVRPGSVIIYFHGGAFIGCGLRTHRRLVGRLSAASGAQVLNVDYRLLPQHPIERAVEDALGAYRHVLDSGVRPERIVFAGDSAGGGLAVLTAMAAREAGLSQPAALVALSPWANLDTAALATHRNARRDAIIPPKAMAILVDRMVAKGKPLDTRLSPIGGDLAGLPPTLIHAGTDEVLEIDAITLADQLVAAGVQVSLKLWTGQIHVFQAAADVIPEARQSIAEIGEFVRAVTTKSPRRSK